MAARWTGEARIRQAAPVNPVVDVVIMGRLETPSEHAERERRATEAQQEVQAMWERIGRAVDEWRDDCDEP